MDFPTIDARIEKKIGKKLLNATIGDGILFGRGSVYIALKRFIKIKDINKELSKY